MKNQNLDISNPLASCDNLERIQKERQVWARLKKGDAQALEFLFRAYYSHLFDYGVKLAREEDLVKDAIQEMFSYIWEKRRNLSEVDSIKAYLLVSLRRLLLNHLDKQRRQKTAHQEFTMEQIADVFSLEDLMIFAEQEASQQKRLRSAFKQIPARMREALYLKTYDNLTYKEIAAIMNVRPQVVRNYLSEAFHRLKAILAPPT
ncbi:MAG: RNA polymerase sigma factor [bacterium]